VINKKYDEKCDVWSCGVILYYMLCGNLPFKGKSQKETFDKVKEGKICYPELIWKEVSLSVKLLIKRMLTMNPKDRARADEVLNNEWI